MSLNRVNSLFRPSSFKIFLASIEAEFPYSSSRNRDFAKFFAGIIKMIFSRFNSLQLTCISLASHALLTPNSLASHSNLTHISLASHIRLFSLAQKTRKAATASRSQRQQQLLLQQQQQRPISAATKSSSSSSSRQQQPTACCWCRCSAGGVVPLVELLAGGAVVLTQLDVFE
jgi:hypothetical protein